MRRLAVLLALLLGLGAAAAGAQEPEGVVVVPFGSGLTELRAYDARGQLCLDASGGDGSGSDCGDPTVSDADAALVTYDGRSYGGAVPAAAARVEFVAADGRVLAATTVAGEAYRGRLAGRVRFFVVEVGRSFPGGSEDVEVRVLDAAGTAIGVKAGDGDGRPVGAPQAVLRRSVGRGRLRVDLQRISILAPSAATLERRVPGVCLAVVLRLSPTAATASSACFPGGEQAMGSLSSDSRGACSPVQVLIGLLPPGATSGSVRATAGDGGLLRAEQVSLAPALPGRSAFLLLVARDRALRSLTVGGRPLAARVPPLGTTCRAATFDESVSVRADPQEAGVPPVRPEGPAATVAAAPVVLFESQGHRLLAADASDDRLCLTLDRADPREAECQALERGPDALLVRRTVEPDGTVVLAGVTRASAAGVRADDRGGAPVAGVQGDAAPAYAGRDAGRLRPFLLRYPRGRVPLAVTVTDAAGKQLPGGDAVLLTDGEGLEPAVTPRRAGRLDHDAVVWSALVPGAMRTLRCAAVTTGRRPRSGEYLCTSRTQADRTTQANVEVGCARRRTIVTALLVGREARLEVVTSAGRRLRARSIAVGDGRRLHRLVLPAGAGLRSVAVRQAGAEQITRRLDLPPATAQCGYESIVE